MKTTLVRTAIAGVVLAASAACGGGSGSVDEVASVEHPCDVPDSALTEAGLDSKPLMTEPFGVEFSGWQGCMWKSTAGWYDAAVYFGPATVDAFRQDPKYQDYRSVGSTTVGDRPAAEFADRLDPERQERCYFAVDIPDGMAWIWSRIPVGPGGNEPKGDLCAEGKRIATELSPYLPE
ncbi:DUF3558 domain-containing protein [Nocardia sp. NPDC058499]|uniref:DUF3558 domain-containing protein n=1 Tax=Nocardia sp. NPDC058499 TaxID=3346530 RepID=UPI00364D7F2C